MSGLAVEWLGTVPYVEALELQEGLQARRRAGQGRDTLYLLEHPPVITLGRSAKPGNVLLDPEALNRRGIEVVEIARGGDVTFHGPGQLVGYLVVNLAERESKDVHRFLRTMEEVLVEVVESFGLRGRLIPDYTGVFIEPTVSGRATAPSGGAAALRPDTPFGRARKIASIGVGVRGWVTCHGFGLNVETDLDHFASIVPCGLQQVEMTTLRRELGERAPEDLMARVVDEVSGAFSARYP